MAKGCACPRPTALTTIPPQDCKVDLEQIQKFGIQRGGYQFDTGADPNPTDPTKKADWLVLKTAIGDTKVVFTPLVGGDPVITPGEPITNGGGDNSTLNGVQELNGINPSQFTGVWKSLSAAVKKAMRELQCEDDLVIYMFNEHGQIILQELEEGVYTGFPIQSFFIGDRGNNGFGSKDTFAVSFSLPAGWDDNLVILEPEAGFRPLQDL